MRLAINRYAAMLVGWIPDVSEIPARRLVLIGVAASLLLHVVFFVLAVLLGGIFSKAEVAKPAPPREIPLAVVPPDEPPPEPVLPLAPIPQRHFLDPTGLDISKVVPEKPIFESSENGVAASEQPGKGDIPLPSQDGRDTPYMAFKSQRALFGPAPQPFAAELEANSQNTPPESNPATAEPSAAATPAPAATPPPKPVEKAEKPPAAQATPPPWKVAERPKEGEIAFYPRPRTTPSPTTAQTEEPKPKPVATPVPPVATPVPQVAEATPTPPPATPLPRVAVATPVPPVAAPTPKFVTRQAMLSTPAPRPQPPAKPSSQIEQEQNHIEGSISNRGRKSASMVATPLGKYRKQVIDAIGSRWQYYVKTHSDVIALGSAQVSFLVDSGGHVRAVRVESNTSNQSFADLCERAIREAEIPEPPAEVIAPMRDGHLEYSINFTLYSL